MDAKRLGWLHRALRQRLLLRQVDVARKSGVSRNKVSFIELGQLDQLSAAEVEKSFAALDAKVEYTVHRRGAALDRLLDEGHARLAGYVAKFLRSLGWQVELEVSFSIGGDRGSIDMLAWHAGTRTLIVIEIKTELGSVDGLLRPLDIKVRHAARIAGERFGWRPLVVARLVALPEHTAARRTIAGHAEVFKIALPQRSHEVRHWLRNPVGPLRGLWFLSTAASDGVNRNPSAIQRVRLRKKSCGQA